MRHLRALALFLVLLATGCLRVEQILALGPDGSATFEARYVVPDTTTERVKAMMRLADEMALASGGSVTSPPPDDFTYFLFRPTEDLIRARIRSYENLGIRIEDLDVTVRNAQREVEFKLFIEDIARLVEADFFKTYGFSLGRLSNGDYVFYNRPLTAEPLDRTWDPTDTEVYKLLAPLLSGFRFEFELRTPGRVLRTGADRRTTTSATWIFDFDADPQALGKLQRAQMKALFEGAGMELPQLQQPGGPPQEADAQANAQ